MKNTLNILFSKKVLPILLSVVLFLITISALIPLLIQPQKTVEQHSIYATAHRSTEEKSIFELKSGDTYSIIKEQNNWYKIRNQTNQIGWIPVWVVDQSDIESIRDVSVLTQTDTPIYDTVTKEQKEIERARSNEQFPIQAVEDQWAKISYNGQEGYIDTSLVEVVASSKKSPTAKNNEFEADNAEFGEIQHKEGEPVQVRESQQFFFEGPSTDSPMMYVIDLNQTFKYIKSVEDHYGEELYYVEDEDQQTGYINSRSAAFLSDSQNHQPAIATSLQEAVITLDAGHGGEDPGAVADDETYEKNLTLSTALILKQVLEEKGAVVIMTRMDDQTVSLKDRAEISNREFSDIFISLHYDELAHDFSGTSTYFYHLDDLNLAQSVNDALTNGPLQNNGIHFGNYQVIRENNHPSLLLELGYISSSKDLDIIKTSDYQQQIAHLITQGIEHYLTTHKNS